MILPSVLIFLSGIIDIILFFKITNIKLKNYTQYFTLIGIWLLGSIVSTLPIGTIAVVLANIITVLSYLKLFNKQASKKLIVGAFIFIFGVDLFFDVLTTIILDVLLQFKIQDIQLIDLISLVFLIPEFLVMFKYSSWIKRRLTNKTSKIFIWLIAYLYIIEVITGIVFNFSHSIPPVTIFMIGAALVQGIFATIAYRILTKTQQNILDEQKQNEIIKELEYQKNYAKVLEKDEDNLRRFKHDYKNILNSIKYSLQDHNYERALKDLDKYTEDNLDLTALSKFRDVNHIQLEYLKSLMIIKLSKMATIGIKYSFECENTIAELPKNISELDLIRVLGIAIDNSIEESQVILKNSTDNPNIQIMLYTSHDIPFEFEVKNKVLNSKISTMQIKQPGFTTKKNHAGLGLSNIQKIVEKYPNINLSYNVQDGNFDFYLAIEEDEIDGN